MLISLSLSKWATRNYKSQKQKITNKYGTFSICTHDDILKLMDKSKNKNTTKATAACINLYHIWAKPRGEVLELAKVETKKQKTTVKIISLILLERGYTHSILKSRKFASSKIVLKGKVQVIPKDGKGRRPNKSSSLVFNSNKSSSRTCPFSSFSGGLCESAILKFFLIFPLQYNCLLAQC